MADNIVCTQVNVDWKLVVTTEKAPRFSLLSFNAVAAVARDCAFKFYIRLHSAEVEMFALCAVVRGLIERNT